MSRLFSSAARAVTRIAWTLNGTTQNMDEALEVVDKAVNAVPNLAAKVNKGIINGDPHPTPYADGTVDELHYSGVLGKGNLKRSNKETSFHYYPRTGQLTFSNAKYPSVRVASSGTQAEQSSTQATQPAAGGPNVGDTRWNAEAEVVETFNGCHWD